MEDPSLSGESFSSDSEEGILQESPYKKRYRENSIRARRYGLKPYQEYIHLSSGQLIRFRPGERERLLIPIWFESNFYVRNILARIPTSVERRMAYLYRFMDEKEGYDEDGHMIYYDLRLQVYESFLVGLRLQRAFRNVLMRWRNRRMDREAEACPVMDPITLAEPEKKVVLYDWSVKKKFVFDAKSLSILIETNLLYHEGGFALPMVPRNPWNNLEFTYRQLLSISIQLQAHGELRWGLTTLRNHDFHKEEWHRYHHSAITMKAIQRSLNALDSPYAKELLEDFIVMQLDKLTTVTPYLLHAYRTAITRVPKHWYLEHWKRLAFTYYETQHFGSSRTEPLDHPCRALYRKQYRFIKELIKNGFIPR